MHAQERIRPPAVAGMFYTGEARALSAEVAGMLAGANRPRELLQMPKALIVPHAGHIYSGPIAASAYALLAGAAETIRRVVMFGPAHRVAVNGLALPEAEAFATPLGVVPLDLAAMRVAEALPQVTISAAAHATEHSLEVQLPFLQAVLGDFKLVPFVVGHTGGHQIAEVIDLLWGGPETLIVISSDLSHYLPYAVARQKDEATTGSILHLQPLTEFEQACGALPINGLIEVAQRRGLKPTLLDLRNSGDTAGDRARVVGYAAFAFEEAGHA